MSEEERFCAILAADPAQRSRFSLFIREQRAALLLTDQKSVWRASESAGVDINRESFRRALDIASHQGRCSKADLPRFAKVFGNKTATQFIAKFRKWSSGRITAHPDATAAFTFDRSGKYVLRPGTNLKGHEGTYVVHKRIGGAEQRGDSYKTKIANMRGCWAFVKTLSLQRDMSATDIKGKIRRFEEFLERERLSLRQLHDVTGVARFLDDGYVDLRIDAHNVVKVPLLVQAHIKGKTLDRGLPRLLGQSAAEFAGVRDPMLWILLARQLLTIVRDVHHRYIRHGDIRPDNVLLHQRRVHLVDFGQSAIVSPAVGEDRGVIENPYMAPERRANQNIPLEISEDLYGLGATLLWMACGPAKFADRKSYDLTVNFDLKRFVFDKVNKELLRHNEGIGHIICQCLHHNPSDRAASADSLLRTLDLFESMTPRALESRSRRFRRSPKPDFARELSELSQTVDSLPSDPIFSDVFLRELSYLLRHARDMVLVNRIEITGSRDEVIASLLSYMATLSPKGLYVTTTTVNFWKPENLGIEGRFLAANKALALQGVTIRRVFVLDRDRREIESPAFRQVAEAQRALLAELRGQGIETEDRSLDGKGFYIGVLEDSAEGCDRILQHGYHIGIIRKGNDALSLSFIEDSAGLVRRILVWKVDAGAVTRRLKDMEGWLAESTPLENITLSPI